jgi:hypothetical protein
MAPPRPAAPPDGRFGVLAEFPTPEALLRACRDVREAGFTRWDAYAPFPIPGLDQAMDLPRSPLPRIALILALGFASAGVGLQVWVSASAFPLEISGSPHFSWPALAPIALAGALLGGALGAVVGLFGHGRLPMLHHPLFGSTRFARATDDGFFVAVESTDPEYDSGEIVELLRRFGAVHVEPVAS